MWHWKIEHAKFVMKISLKMKFTLFAVALRKFFQGVVMCRFEGGLVIVVESGSTGEHCGYLDLHYAHY